ncbi:MAG: eukaryotic-like serine/threonine-protein kinase [Frankiaceae bacterium]|jgi:serine/threonine-protein kinase|nr:eukaryotic-like serine/threonine-protein kinase [Frankiaceae bacterium]
MTAPTASGTPGGRLLGGRYELGGLLGHGGMAEVYRAADTRLGRDVAIKVLRNDLARDPTFLSRFRREAQAAASLNHPMIVAVYDTGQDNGVTPPLPYIVMEYIKGPTLREVLQSEGRITPQRASEIVAEVCSALEYSHRAGIIHRDIKPGNVMLTVDGAVKVMDFGIARAVAATTSTVTATAAVMGTAQYLSPEQARGENVDARSDLYSAGVLFYELLTGHPPFTGDSPVAIAYQHVREDPAPPSTSEPDLPPDLDAVVLKALAKNPDNRYQSAQEMRDDLDRVLAGTKVLATPVLRGQAAGGTEVRRRGPLRRRLLYGALALVVVAALVGAALLARGLLAGPDTTSVPDLTNATRDAAISQLEAQGLRPGNVTDRESAVPPGLVLEQNPAAGAVVDKDSTVDFVLSRGPGTRLVPDVSGLSQDEATRQLTSMQLEVATTTVDDLSEPVGTVSGTSPDPGTSVPTGSTVTLQVVSGFTTVPNLVNQPEGQATRALTSLGLNPSITRQTSTDHAPDIVLAQSPAAGGRVSRGGRVTLTVSQGVASASPVPAPSPSPSASPSRPPSPSPTPRPAATR